MPVRLDARLVGDLFFFRALVEAGGFARAGDRLAVTQSAVTQRIQRLEQRLGYLLLERGGREIRLTAEGHDLFAAARNGFDGMGDALLRAERREGRETLRISCIPSLASEWLAPRLRAFSDRHPGIDVAVFGETHDLDPDRMAQSGIDVAIRYGPAPPPARRSSSTIPSPSTRSAPRPTGMRPRRPAGPSSCSTTRHRGRPRRPSRRSGIAGYASTGRPGTAGSRTSTSTSRNWRCGPHSADRASRSDGH